MLKVSLHSAVAILLTLALGSFAYQYFRESPDYLAAAERTYFQGVAIFMAWLLWRKGSDD